MLSRWMFQWMWRTVIRARRHKLTEAEIRAQMPASESCEANTRAVRDAWHAAQAQSSSSSSQLSLGTHVQSGSIDEE